MQKNSIFLSLLTISLLLIAEPAEPHGGRTNASGCHNDNVNGGSHCHDGSSSGGSGSYGSGSSSGGRVNNCPFTTKNSWFLNLTALNSANNISGTVQNIISVNSILDGKKGVLISYQVNNSVVKQFNYEEPSLGTVFAIGQNSPDWFKVETSIPQSDKGFNVLLAENNRGIRQVVLNVRQEITNNC